MTKYLKLWEDWEAPEDWQDPEEWDTQASGIGLSPIDLFTQKHQADPNSWGSPVTLDNVILNTFSVQTQGKVITPPNIITVNNLTWQKKEGTTRLLMTKNREDEWKIKIVALYIQVKWSQDGPFLDEDSTTKFAWWKNFTQLEPGPIQIEEAIREFNHWGRYGSPISSTFPPGWEN